ncbi:MAG TPA: phosphatidylserine decarboxylase [Niallia sp.]|nr:phosphatidylserine decarboxylase [Niallia sp.]
MKEAIYRLLIELTNGKWSSYLIKKFVQSNWSGHCIPPFSKFYNINIHEMEKDIKDYKSLHEFFIRKLKDNAREIESSFEKIISPVDAIIEDIGNVQKNRMITVKGKSYSILDMLGDEQVVNKYIDGHYMILYLSPSHYHRIHSPVFGEITKQWTLGSKSYPVNKYGLKWGKDTLSKNYRTVTEIQTKSNDYICMVKVGAMFINSIVISHREQQLVKGEEMAYFSFGSTVVLLFEKDKFKQRKFPSIPYQVKIGEVIGEFKQKEN